jgi:type II restriction enzyme
MKRNFNNWLNTFKESISTFDYYVDFSKVYRNVDKIKVELNILNSLIGSKNIESEFKQILNKYPSTIECIPILLAIRKNEIFIKQLEKEYLFKFDTFAHSIEEYCRFMSESGLFELLQNHLISNLYDYVLGVEVGLDSNSRKNRGGFLMENLVETYIQKLSLNRGFDYYKEISTKEIELKWNMNLSKMSGDGISKKVFDFVIKSNSHLYVFETNFYASSGSKLNETARSYKLLAEQSKQIDGLTFIWITDGIGWLSAKNNLKETFNTMDTLYNIKDLESGILDKIII